MLYIPKFLYFCSVMNFDWRNLDLRKANIFDLTDDIELIHQCGCGLWIESVDDRDEYVRKNSTTHVACDMISYAYLVKDDELHAELEKTFSKEYAEFQAQFDDYIVE